MVWQKQLKMLEDQMNWDAAILLMESVIAESPTKDSYLAMSYLLMNLLVEENYEDSKHDYYEGLSKKYFRDGYEKFSNNAEYLFFISIIAVMSEWYVDLDTKDIHMMQHKAFSLEPHNDLYLWGSYGSLNGLDHHNSKLIYACEGKILDNPTLVNTLKSKGSLGEYILGMITHSYANKDKHW